MTPLARTLGARCVLMLLHVALTCVLVGCLDDDVKESFYASLADAERDGAMDRGWIPDFLPASAHNIRERHHVSGGETWCAFDMDPVDWQRFRERLEQHSVARQVKRVRPPRVSWWPAALTNELDPSQIARAGFELRTLARDQSETMSFAIDSSKGRVWFYRAPS
jgi:hypothetical protein